MQLIKEYKAGNDQAFWDGYVNNRMSKEMWLLTRSTSLEPWYCSHSMSSLWMIWLLVLQEVDWQGACFL